MYFSARTEGRISYGHLGRTDSCFSHNEMTDDYLAIEVTKYHCGVIRKMTSCTNEKKRSEETQTLRAGYSKAEPKFFAPAADPFPGARDGQNLISWRWSLPSPTDPVW